MTHAECPTLFTRRLQGMKRFATLRGACPRRVDTGGVTIIEFPDGVDRPGVVRCLNYTAHLGDKWVIPAFGDDIDGVCGVDGCF